MIRLVSASAAAALAGLMTTPALAQQTPALEPGSPAGEVAQTGTVAVSQLKLVSGVRASKLIGATVYNDANEKSALWTISFSRLRKRQSQRSSRLEASSVPEASSSPCHITSFQMDKENKLVMAGANKDSLNAMPSFTYGGATGGTLLPQ